MSDLLWCFKLRFPEAVRNFLFTGYLASLLCQQSHFYRVVSHFKIYICFISRIILDTNPLSVNAFANTFFQFTFFTLLMGSSHAKNFLQLKFLNLFLYDLCFLFL